MRALDVTSGEVLRQARSRAGLTQRDLASRAGVSQSVIAAYERDSREPALSTLAALVEATGVSLYLDLTASGVIPQIGGPISRRLRRKRATVLAIAARYGIRDMRVFGSVARGNEGPNSDLDLLVRLPAGMDLIDLASFTLELEDLLRVKVDVVPDDALKPRVRARIESDLLPL